jgi:hypothetical protein
LQNNTIVLASLGWRGFWVGSEELAFSIDSHRPEANRGFVYIREFVNLDNVLSITRRALSLISEPHVDVLSLDLDGNDIYLIEELLANRVWPLLYIVEYNAKFMPPIRWRTDYDPAHTWNDDDYFGASLMEFNDLFEKHGYFLACCNPASGSNAFFVRNEHRDVFKDVPNDIEKLWAPPAYISRRYGHPQSARTVAKIINNIRGSDLGKLVGGDCGPNQGR